MTEFLTRQKAAEFLQTLGLKVSKRSLEMAAMRKDGPHYALVAGRAMYKPDDLRKWVDERFTKEEK